ncbi:hypothetical protein ACQY0O_004948 [Thecaphora frezii]
MPRLYIVTNPVSGDHQSVSVLDNVVRPLLDPLDFDLINFQTESLGDGARIGGLIRQDLVANTSALSSSSSSSSSSPALKPQSANVVLLGGDGTTNEVLNGFFASELDVDHKGRSGSSLAIHLVIVPTGSANALCAACFPPPPPSPEPAVAEDAQEWRTRSLRSFLAQASPQPSNSGAKTQSKLVPLTLMLNETLPLASDAQPPQPSRSLTHLVTSHALHAAILYDSETPEMRQRYPGIERFKIAAQNNATRWIRGRLRLQPLASTGAVSRYNPQSRAFEPLPAQEAELDGPFLYLAALTTDRLETHFVPAPFSSTFSTAFEQYHELGSTSAQSLQRPAEAVDIVSIRPHRDPRVEAALPPSSDGRAIASDTVRIEFASTRLVDITKAMYDGGRHVDLVYEDVTGERAALPRPMVEYLRTGGYRFVPDGDDERASLVCLDGRTLRSQETSVSVLCSTSDQSRAFVWT